MIMVINDNKLLSMKKIFINIGLLMGLSSMFLLNSCKEDIPPVVDQLSFNRAFTPIGFSSVISNVTTVTLSWAPAKNTDHYIIETYNGTDFVESALIQTDTIPALPGTVNVMSLQFVLPAGDTQFSTRIKAVSSLTGVEDSKWASTTYKSGPENLFTNYASELSGLNACTVRWKPGSVATALLFVNGTTETSYPITAGEMVAGVKVLTSIPNAKYEVRLMNGTFVRGKRNLALEGNVMLASGDNLLTAITAANPGDVILLPQGGMFVFTGNTIINKSIKIRAIYNTNQPTLYVASGASTTAPMFLIDPALTPSDSIVFQNVTITGYINNNSPEGMITGVYDQGTSNACNLGTLRFESCVLSHFSRHLIRLRGTATQYINNFVVNNCTLFDYSTNSTSYGIISSNTALGTINNITFSNSTIYNFLSYLVLYSNNAASTSIVVKNCSLNQITNTTGSTSRYIIDANATTLSSGITIQNCIFGSTAAAHTNGVRTSATLTISNSYRTSDYDDSFTPAYSIMTSLIAYSGASTALWIDPLTTHDFHFLDAGFIGKSSTGDPHWRP
jgi:hypothetical protein